MVQDLPSVVESYLAGQEIACFYGTWTFITTFTKAYHWTASSATLI